MALLKILEFPNPKLRQRASEVRVFDNTLKTTCEDMLETMYDAKGIGLAAIQVGIPKRVIVLDVNQENENKNPLCFINPIIKNISEEKSKYEEGCLSIPNQFAKVDRPEKCHVKYLDYNGDKKEIKAEGLLSTCIQHEIDHLDGILFIDYLSKLKKDMIIKKLVKQKKEINKIVL